MTVLIQPEERRVAPVMLPCEFCNEMFPERNLMCHQTSCDLNETQMPRVRRDSLASPPMLNSPTTLSSPKNPNKHFISNTSNPSNNLDSPNSPTGRRRRIPDSAKPPTPEKSKTPPKSPPLRPPQIPHSNSSNSSVTSTSITFVRSSLTPTTNIDTMDSSSSESRPTSVSPCPAHSNNSCTSSSGISSIASSIRSVSSTPSSSNSASPIPTVVDTPTDIEADFEDDDAPYMKPRKGKLLSSAIGSWRSLSMSNRDRPRYTRSNTAPLEDTGDEPVENHNLVINSHSASQLPPLPPRPESTSSELEKSSLEEMNNHNISATQQASNQKSKSQQVFIKRHKKYRAPPPPTQIPPQAHTQSNLGSNNNNPSIMKQLTNEKSTASFSSVFHLDSKPMMNSEQTTTSINKTCEYCKEIFVAEDFESHKVSNGEIIFSKTFYT